MAGAATDILEWTGAAADGDWDTAGNWSTYSGSPTTTTPSDGEGVLFARLATTPLTVSPSSAVALNNFTVLSSCGVSVGTSGTSLSNVSVDSGSAPILQYAGQGAHFYFGGSITTALIQSSAPSLFSLTGGTTALLICHRGRIIVQSGAGVTNIDQNGSILTIKEHSTPGTDIASLDQSGGSTVSDRDIDTINLSGALLGAERSILTMQDDAASDTAIVQMGGVLNWRSSGTVASLVGHAGVFTPRDNPNNGFTITASVRHLNRHRLDQEWEGGTITLSSDTAYGSGTGPMNFDATRPPVLA